MLKRFISIALCSILLLYITSSFAAETITSYNEETLPVLNEELRKINNALRVVVSNATSTREKVKANSSDPTAGYLDAKANNSIVVNFNKLELSGDSATPGNSKVYGTNITGTKGWLTQLTFVDRGDPSAVDFTLTPADTDWHDLNMSSVVTVGTSAAALRVHLSASTAGRELKLRENDNSNEINIFYGKAYTANTDWYFDTIVACDANATIEYKFTNPGTWTTATLTVIGWWQ